MKKFFLVSILCLTTIIAIAQPGSRARYAQLVQAGKYDEAITEGIAVTEKLLSSGQSSGSFQPMFDFLNEMEQMATANEPADEYHLRYRVQRERFKVYMGWSNAMRKKEHFTRLEAIAAHLSTDADIENWLQTKAWYYSQLGTQDQVSNCYRTILTRRRAGKTLDETDRIFKDVITLAKTNGMSVPAAMLTGMYNAWKDSMAVARIEERLHAVEDTLTNERKLLAERDSSITSYKMSMGGLGLLAVVLTIMLAIAVFIVLRDRIVIMRLKRSLSVANASNAQKSGFIGNISSHIAPYIEGMSGTMRIKSFLSDIETYMKLEDEREKRYEVAPVNVETLCKSVMNTAKESFTSLVETHVDAPSTMFNVNADVSREMLHYLITTSVTIEGTKKVTLEFRKRGAHVGMFIVTVLGGLLTEEQRENIFTAFAQNHAPGDESGLGYPICALKAYRMNATLQLDSEFTKGTRFLLKVNE